MSESPQLSSETVEKGKDVLVVYEGSKPKRECFICPLSEGVPVEGARKLFTWEELTPVQAQYLIGFGLSLRVYLNHNVRQARTKDIQNYNDGELTEGDIKEIKQKLFNYAFPLDGVPDITGAVKKVIE